MEQHCIFCRIVRGEAPCHRIAEDADHLAFLSIFPNTPGFSVAIPKRHHPSYAFDLPDAVLSALTLFARSVGKLIDRNLPGVGRTGMIFEGFGVDHVHAKLFPMHGVPSAGGEWRRIGSSNRTFFARYEGYISSHDGERCPDGELQAIARRIAGGSPG
jgi:diadenosine tetraphosphate (Ap4A) HIT family hydrolase